MKRERNKSIKEPIKEKTEEEIIQERLTWQGEAIKTLNILEKDFKINNKINNVNIYDEKRFGGMYLKQKDGKSLAESKKLSEIFDKNESINTKESQIDDSQLSSFFKNN